MNFRSDLFEEGYRAGRWSQYVLLAACLAGVVGMLTMARALVALAPVGGVIAAVLNPGVRQAIPGWLRNRAAQRAACLYLLLPLTWWYTQDWHTWQHELFRQLPLVAGPLAFALAVPLNARQRFAIGVAFCGGIATIGLATLISYLMDPAAAEELINKGQNVPSVTDIFHIHFGIMLALASFMGVSLSQERQAGKWGRWLLLSAAAVAALSLHVLAYRTGLFAFYLALAASAVLLLFRRPKLGVSLLVLGGGLAAGAYFGLPSIRTRIASTVYDLEQFYYGHDINNFSLARRLAAWKNAEILVKEHPWLGVAPADVRQVMDEQFSWQTYGLEQTNRVMIHNQYLHYLVGAGVVGLLLWLWVLIAPLGQPGLRQNPYVKHFLLIFGAAALADSLLELQIGFNLFVFLYSFLVVAAERRFRTADVTR